MSQNLNHPINTDASKNVSFLSPSARATSRSPAASLRASSASSRTSSQPALRPHTPTSIHTPSTPSYDSDSDMDDRRPPLHRPTDGRSHQPLLDERGRSERPVFSRSSTMRSRSPDTQAKLATKKKYTYAAFFLVLSLISFVIQTETAVYIQHELGWNKAYCML